MTEMNEKTKFCKRRVHAAAEATTSGAIPEDEHGYIHVSAERLIPARKKFPVSNRNSVAGSQPEVRFAVSKLGDGGEGSSRQEHTSGDIEEPPRFLSNALYQTFLQSRVSTSESRLSRFCKYNKILIALVAFLAITSITSNSYVAYILTTKGLHSCDCATRSSSFGTPLTTESAIDPIQTKKTLKAQVEKLRRRMQKQNTTDTPFDRLCVMENPMKCHAELVENFTTQVAEAMNRIEQNLKERKDTNEELKRARTEVNAKMNKSQTVERSLFAQCNWHVLKETSAQRFVNVSIPQKKENLVTVGVTCLTTAENASTAINLVPPTKDTPDFSCNCRNDDTQKRKRIDCIAHYWQCSMS